MERKDALIALKELAREFPGGTLSAAELDEVLIALAPLLRKLLLVYLIAGVRPLAGEEARAHNDTELEYWFAATDPELAAALARWLSEDLMARLKRAGVVTFESPAGVQKLPLDALLARVRKDTTG